MSSRKGNSFWKLRAKHGRERIFASSELMWDSACKYFEWVDRHPYFEVEQRKGNIKPVKDVNGNVIYPDEFVKLPRMRPYTLHGLCIYLGVNTKYFNDFEKSLEDKEDQLSKGFSEVISRIKEIIYENKFSGAAAGFFNSNLISRELGLADKKDLTSENEKLVFHVTMKDDINK